MKCWQMAAASGLTIAQMKRANELKFRTASEIDRASPGCGR